jgi:lysophospholipase L1-like esterase
MPQHKPNRFIPVNAASFAYPLRHFRQQIAGGGEVRIVAIGSSSTAGEGGIASYPARLQSLVAGKYGKRVVVLNRGVGGEEAPDEVKRFRSDVIAQKPALVIWQVGTNAVWQPGHNLADVAAAIAEGLAQLGGVPTDVVLMDLQYVPALLTEDTIDETRRMQSLITGAAAATAGVNVFRRFDMMRKWIEVEKRSFDALVDPGDGDRLHLSDYSTQRVAFELYAKLV